MNKGYSIIEVLVSILLFFLIMGAGMGVFVSVIKLQKYNLKHQQLLSQTSYAMEYMSRAIRMAQKDDGTCGFSGKNYELGGGNSIEFKTYHGQCWKFYVDVDNKQLKLNKDGTEYDLISDKFKVEPFTVIVSGDESGKQPKVTIFMEIRGEGSDSQPRLKIQTTISQRNLNL